MKKFLLLSTVFVALSTECQAAGQRISAFFDVDQNSWFNQLSNNVIITLPDGTINNIKAAPQQRIPISNGYALKNGDKISYKIVSLYGKEPYTQQDVCNGSIILVKDGKSLESIQLSFTRTNNNLNGPGPWFTCTVKPKRQQ